MVIDFEKAWLDFKATIVSKPSHGQRDLLAEMARIEVRHTVPEAERNFDPTPPNRSTQPNAGRLRAVVRDG